MFLIEQTHPRGIFWLLLSSAAKQAFLCRHYVFPRVENNSTRYLPDVPLADELRAFYL